MYLSLITSPKTSSSAVARRRRSAATRNGGNVDCSLDTNDYGRCCRYPLIVNFHEIGWDFIIAPKMFDAKMCQVWCQFMAGSWIDAGIVSARSSGNVHPFAHDGRVKRDGAVLFPDGTVADGNRVSHTQRRQSSGHHQSERAQHGRRALRMRVTVASASFLRSTA
jgi:hypothetical protein